MALDNYGAMIGSGMALVPDYARQQAERQMSGLLIEGQKLQNQNFDLKNTAEQQGMDQQAAFQSDLDAVLMSPTAQAYSSLILKHPKYAQQVKNAFQVQDEAKRTSDLRQMGEVYSAAAVGKYDIAAKAMRSRVEADKAADGIADPQDEAILAALESNDPMQQKAALGQVGIVLSAITGPEKFSATLGSLKQGSEDFSLSPGMKRFDAAGNEIASAPFAPRPVSVSAGETVFEYKPEGGGPTSGGAGGPLSIGNVLPAIVQQESGGNYAARNASTGAMGAYQVMPTTAKTLAGRLGLEWQPGLMTSATPEGRAYQDKIGQAAVQEAIDAGGGDPITTAAYYHGGSDRSKWGPKTQQYAQEVAARLGGGQQGNMRPIATGGPAAPKPTASRMSPEEVAAEGLDPNIVYYRGTDGIPKPVGNQPKSQGVGAAGGAYSQSALDAFDRAISTANRLGKHPGLNAAVGVPSINPLDGNLAGYIVPGSPAADFRAELDAMKAQVFLPMVQSMKGMGALSNEEGKKLTAAIGALTPSQSEGQFKQSLKRIIDDLNTYKARGMPKGGQGGAGGPVKVRSVQEAMKLAPGTVYIAPDGKTRRR